jgi:pimeloyl-ACP methyl ester carboxylesterase
MAFFEHAGVSIYYERHGSGPPLMLIAGLASDSQSWLPIVADLSKLFTVILPDNRGVGRSTQECQISIDLMADDCIALARHLGFEKVSLLGHSMGGMVAIECAIRYPDLVDRLLLAATTARNSPRNNQLFLDWATWYASGYNRPAWFRNLLTWIFTEHFFDNQQILDGSLLYLLNYPWPQSAEALRKQVDAIAAFDASDQLSSITVPVCIIVGSKDILLPPSCSEQLAAQIPGALLTRINGAAHSIHMEQPQPFIHEIVTFLHLKDEETPSIQPFNSNAAHQQ